MSEDQGSAGGVNYYGTHGDRIVGLGPQGEARTLFGRPLGEGRGPSDAEDEYRAWLDDAAPWKPFQVGDVLRHSVRAESVEQYEAFDTTVLRLLVDRMDLRLLVGRMDLRGALADIVYIAAGEMIGPVDPLEAYRRTRPWNIEDRSWQADGDARPWSALDRFLTVLLPEGEPLVVLKQRAAGYTQYYPAAVYLAGGAADDLKRDAVPMTANLVHEYTHLALGRIYANASLPWPDSRRFDPDRTHALGTAFAAAAKAGETALGRGLTGITSQGLREILRHIARTLAGMSAVDLDREAVPYLIEAEIAAACHDEPEAVSAVFGTALPAAFEQYVAPELRAAAAAIDDAGLLRW
ncbi:hypothetical protein ACIQWZ_31390 [Streptomyces sp. NPDC098077]|uniref:hypothetical protein n=1 Tax=Streptomyces sp. NPDC098077 TaxID=3366093 RepID=UPI00380A5A51